jgi:hypothetical protein
MLRRQVTYLQYRVCSQNCVLCDVKQNRSYLTATANDEPNNGANEEGQDVEKTGTWVAGGNVWCSDRERKEEGPKNGWKRMTTGVRKLSVTFMLRTFKRPFVGLTALMPRRRIVLLPKLVPSFISRGAAHTKRRERPLLAKEGTMSEI